MCDILLCSPDLVAKLAVGRDGGKYIGWVACGALSLSLTTVADTGYACYDLLK